MSRGNVFSGYNTRSVTAARARMTEALSADQPTWNKLPELVQLNIFKYLDRRSLNTIRQISATARPLIENVFGLRAILPGPRWSVNPNGHWELIGKEGTSQQIRHLIRQMGETVIRTLRIGKLPQNIARISFSRLVKHPRRLLEANLQFADLNFVHHVLSQCVNLRILEYIAYKPDFFDDDQDTASEEGAAANNLLTTVNNFPERAYHLPYLKQLILATSGIGSVSTTDSCEWGNAVYLLLALPVLPSLTEVNLIFNICKDVSRTAHMLLYGCIGDFLMKLPSLRELTFRSLYNRDEDWEDEEGENPVPILNALIRKSGSAVLREAAEGIPHLLLDRVQSIFVGAARCLVTLEKLDLIIVNDIHNMFLGTLVRNLPNPALLTRVCVTDRTDITEQDTLATEVEKVKVYKLFTVRNDEVINDPDQGAITKLSPYQTLTDLELGFGFVPNTTLSLNKIVEQLPQLRSLIMKKFVSTEGAASRAYVHFDENPDQSPFGQLKKLALINLSVADLASPSAPSVTGLILQCKNLKELVVGYSYGNQLWYDHVNTGIHVTDLLQILTSLRKLDKLLVNKVHFTLSRERLDLGELMESLDDVEQVRMTALEEVGTVRNGFRNRRRLMLVGGVLQNVVDVSFAFGPVDPLWKEVEVDMFVEHRFRFNRLFIIQR